MAKIKEQIDYGGRREKMDPSLERKLASPDSLYAQNPAMKKGAADVQRLVSQRFGKVADKLRAVVGNRNISSLQFQVLFLIALARLIKCQLDLVLFYAFQHLLVNRVYPLPLRIL